MNQNFAAIVLGGTGQVGGAAVAELLAIPECREVVMITRKPIAPRSRVRNAVLDTGAADFAERTAALAREVLSQGPASAVSCVGVGSGSARWSEEELQRLEIGVVGAFARGCHDAGIAQFCLLSAAGSTARSRFRYARVMGMKEDTVRNVGFARLAIFRPGITVANAHTPAWVGWLRVLVPGLFGNIDQRILGRSIAAEIALHSREAGEVIRENATLKKTRCAVQSRALGPLAWSASACNRQLRIASGLPAICPKSAASVSTLTSLRTKSLQPQLDDVSIELLSRSEQPTGVVHETICEQVRR